ncbi:hypothetical protein HIM_04034 [Hirsutella minnesotensis 3608]|uniref:glutathione-specific gamma-glutamylcyclotransferase n=1 Tax=Hirsutella minnesotensis 3608 TaxID=1043627 RepID=A0A0F7ZVJ0_9HYPO|nr:hypothetical protein HIM_04034 [Hirsutella minnesotensis 3608]
MTASESSEFWLFGYGSLIWKPPPHFDRRVPGWVTGYVRRFWQVSSPGLRLFEDHRGTPEAPGRVVTLIQKSYWDQLTDQHAAGPDKVWGVAYRILSDRVAQVKDYLDIREINGYSIHYTPFHPADGSPSLTTLVYIGTPDNEQFVGPQDPHKLAAHILRSQGPSGLNKDYLYNLHVALQELSPESGDHHISDLAQRVKKLEHDTASGVAAPTPRDPDQDFRQESSTTEAEEVEKA